MNTIKFAFQYPKLLAHDNRPIERAKLLQVLPVELADLTAEFLEFDTYYNKYPLPKQGKYLMLIFMKPGNCDLFTTLRRSTPEKKRFYTSQVGEVFHVQFTTEPATI